VTLWNPKLPAKSAVCSGTRLFGTVGSNGSDESDGSNGSDESDGSNESDGTGESSEASEKDAKDEVGCNIISWQSTMIATAMLSATEATTPM